MTDLKKINPTWKKETILEKGNEAVDAYRELLKKYNKLSEKLEKPKPIKTPSTNTSSLDDLDKLSEEYNLDTDSLKNQMLIVIDDINDKKTGILNLSDTLKSLLPETEDGETPDNIDEVVDMFTATVDSLEQKLNSLKESNSSEVSNYIEEMTDKANLLKETISKLENQLKIDKARTQVKYERDETQLLDSNKLTLVKFQETNNNSLEDTKNELSNKLTTRENGLLVDLELYETTIREAVDNKHTFNSVVMSMVTSQVRGVEKKYENIIEGINDKNENELRIKKTQLNTINTNIQLADKQIEQLQQSVRIMNNKAYDLSVKRAEMSSSSEALEAVKEVTLKAVSK